MSKSIVKRLSVQIPEEEQPEFLAATFSTDVLRKALEIGEQLKLEREEEVLNKLHTAINSFQKEASELIKKE